MHAELCPVCKGSGRELRRDIVCPGCVGKGWVEVQDSMPVLPHVSPHDPWYPHPVYPPTQPYYPSGPVTGTPWWQVFPYQFTW